MKTRIFDREEAVLRAADSVCELLSSKPEAVLALGANDECLLLYRELARRAAGGTLDLSRARFFAVTEFDGLAPDDGRSCRARLRAALLDLADPEGKRSVFPDADTVETVDRQIADCGGLDLAVLGIGERGRIGFNEPGTPFDSTAHRQKLTKATKRELAPLFGGEDKTPDFGYTLGIHTLTEAGRILLLALGEERADPVFRMLYARTDSFVPAAFLQIPLQVEIVLDRDAAAKL